MVWRGRERDFLPERIGGKGLKREASKREAFVCVGSPNDCILLFVCALEKSISAKKADTRKRKRAENRPVKSERENKMILLYERGQTRV